MTTILDAMHERHSVRRFTNQPITGEVLAALQAEISAINAESGLDIRLVTDDPHTFSSVIAKVRFSGTRNFIVLAGKDSPGLDEVAGYYGERVVLKAQQLGLNTCWAGMISGKKYANKLPKDERIVIVIVVGYGVSQGEPHQGKPMDALCKVDGPMPDWFRAGMEAAMLAPTALNQQRFHFTLAGDTVLAESSEGSLAELCLGIAKYHFELGAGKDNFQWA